MKKKTFLSGSMTLGALLLIGAGCAGNIQPDTSSSNKATGTQTDTSIVAEPSTQIGDPSQQSGRYEAYDESKLALADTGDVILFFKADWCPSCKVLEDDILSKKDSIPADLTILKLNYDKELELRKKYRVTTQHTLVQIDSKGDLIQKWSGDLRLEELVNRVK